MKWVTYRASDSSERVGLVRDSSIYGLDDDTALIDLLGDDGSELASAAERAEHDPIEVIDLATADLAPPIRPPQVRDFLCFLDHLRNAQAAAGIDMDPLWEQIPAFYFSNTSSVIGPNDPVEISPGCVWFDYELEIAAIIGRGGRDIHPDEAESHIAGYTIFCDWSARDLQMREMKLSLGPSKGKDGANTFGPMLVTADELESFRAGNSYHLEMAAYPQRRPDLARMDGPDGLVLRRDHRLCIPGDGPAARRGHLLGHRAHRLSVRALRDSRG